MAADLPVGGDELAHPLREGQAVLLRLVRDRAHGEHVGDPLVAAVDDVAVNVGFDVLTAERDIDVGTAWSEGWHTDQGVDYPVLGVHSTDFTTTDLVAQLQAELASVNHISIYSTGYGPSGTHLVHHNTNGNDGAIVTRPLSHPSHVRMYRFDNQSF